MESDDWLTELTTALSGSPGLTLVAGMVAGVLANVILRARNWSKCRRLSLLNNNYEGTTYFMFS